MTGFIPKFQRQRSPRIESKPGRFSCVVHYQSAASKEPLVAQFGDISESGMRLISRHLANAKVSDLLTLEFTLPGSKRQLGLQARVVRRINDFTFAVRFAGLDDYDKKHVREAINEYVEFSKPSLWRDLQHDFGQWIMLHRRGVTISLVGALLAGVIGMLIYANSDEHHGRDLRSWGDYPKNWSRDYWAKDSYNSSSSSTQPSASPTPNNHHD